MMVLEKRFIHSDFRSKEIAIFEAIPSCASHIND